MTESIKTIALGGVNVYLVKLAPPPDLSAKPSSKAFVLIDTGISWSWQRLRAALRATGCTPGTLRVVVLTHGDIDHAGNCVNLRREYGAPIAMHRGDVPMVETGLQPKRWRMGVLGKALGLIVAALFWLRLGPKLETFTPDVLLQDGQRLEEFGWAARVIHVPGHTKGSIAVLAEDGSLFAGDELFDATRPPLIVENLDELRSSVAKLRRLPGEVTTVYPGHGKPFPADRMGRMRL